MGWHDVQGIERLDAASQREIISKRTPSDGRGLGEQLVPSVVGTHVGGELDDVEPAGIQLRELL
jgi:hypothetical protein